METLAYIHLALADEVLTGVGLPEKVDWRKFSSQALIYLLPVIAVSFGILGIARDTLAQQASRGDSGVEVRLIQQRLQKLQYFNPEPTGFFGGTTESAVKEFQRINGLAVDGIVGQETEAVLFGQVLPPKPPDKRTILRRGDRGSDVTQLQEWLTEINLNPGSINGFYGSQTESAVRQFQAARGLLVTGVANEGTQRELQTVINIIREPRPNENAEIVNTGRTGLRKGDRGEDVAQLQEWLTYVGFNPGWIDGVYGSQTQRAVIQFQTANNLPVTGAADEWTLRELEERIDRIDPPDERRYVVIVPGDYSTLAQVQDYFPNARWNDDRRGGYVDAGSFENRNEAESWSYFLRANELNARVAYF